MDIKDLLINQYSFKNHDLFEGLPDEICDIMKENRVTLNLAANQSIFVEGEKPKGIYRVQSGKIKKHTQTNFNKPHIFYICTKNEFLGYHAVLSEELYADSATTLSDCVIDFIPEIDFKKAVNASHQLSQRLLKTLSHEFRVFINATKLLAKYTVRERTALNLLILESKFGSNIIMTREDLANMVGTAMESLVRTLKDFKEENLIKIEGRNIFIEDYNNLIKVANFL